ncbi:hypothetical protein CHS0354_016202 [Potamilus streckersoni]|uniref:Protein phosphatase 1 regulatory subunit 35 C-terminal domain-containing protein n=1 Tax=Potamilus streckersoni TaxID=2493646 RepID=A0AAE0RXN2_9BIVA|nr:hypothetical protein CHS0354_016202 [Potamilus streckersoni]
MATHFICHSTEPLAHLYPSGPGNKTHGAVSEYEVYSYANKVHTNFPHPGFDFSQSLEEEDSLPLCRPVPQPSWQVSDKPSAIIPDPNLCVTPEKPPMPMKFFALPAHLNPDPVLCVTPEGTPIQKGPKSNLKHEDKEKCKHRVRFQIEDDSEIKSIENELDFDSAKSSQSKPYSPAMYSDDRTNSFKFDSETGSKSSSWTVKYNLGQVDSVTVHDLLSSDGEHYTEPPIKPLLSESSDKLSQHVESHRNTKTFPKTSSQTKIYTSSEEEAVSHEDSHADPIAQSRGGEPKRKVVVLRENQSRPKLKDYMYPFENEDEVACALEHVFAKPEYNSTLRLNKEIQHLKECEIDITKALQKKLQSSEIVKTEINEKAASRVNKESEASTFQALISLDVPLEDIQAASLKPVIRPTKSTKLKSTVASSEPDLMEFFSADLQKESVDLSTPGVNPPTEQLSTASPLQAFDLYRHNRVWEGSNRQ